MSDTGVVFLEGFKTILRPLDKTADIESVTRWINSPKNRQFILQYLPQTRPQEEKWLEEHGKSPSEITLGIVAKPEMHLIGLMGLHRVDWKNGNATTGAIIGESAYWGKGYGTDAKMALLEYAFLELGLQKICSSVLAFNNRSMAYSMHCGYTVEGTLKRHIHRGGRYHDLVLLAVFRRQWEPIWRRWKKTGSVK